MKHYFYPYEMQNTVELRWLARIIIGTNPCLNCIMFGAQISLAYPLRRRFRLLIPDHMPLQVWNIS